MVKDFVFEISRKKNGGIRPLIKRVSSCKPTKKRPGMKYLEKKPTIEEIQKHIKLRHRNVEPTLQELKERA